VAFNAWDGGNGEHGLIMSLSPWYFLAFERPVPAMAYLSGVLGAAAMGVALIWLRSFALNSRAEGGGVHEKTPNS
jgi:hypothetical protein